ncbi:putative cytochrome P450 [Rosa chinensis]|uniref:Putative cytochrome P450 n=1 Tax=Rosa chinensis TaxID=74649 RepID=A0A2P6PT95_ROSCH|nr:cucurbitadienol 11-hydroxylase [Rosa chinensis]PRQ25147.1 putative cytochrome P450 [Rosa chinensis]
MWTEVGLCLVAFLVIYITHWIIKWRNPKCNGVLPPGSMGLPLIGETLSLIIPSYSLDLHPFIKKRLERYGPIFRTSLAGRPVVISADPEFNNFLFQQEGRSVELWYLDTFSKIFVHEGESKTNAVGIVHKYVRSIFLNHFGAERLKEKLLPEIQEFVNKSLCSWSSQESVEVKHAGSVMVLNFSAKQMISYDAEKSADDLSEKYTKIIDGLMSFPLNIPGTAYYNCTKHQKKVTTMLRDMLKERHDSPETQHGDFLDQIANDMDKEKFLSQDFSVQLVFGGLFATFESISAVLALAFSLLAEHPSVFQELTAEHEAILKNREDPNTSLTWDEYKSMTFTLQVINETLRLGNVAPGLLRRALRDIPVKGFTIPKGWTIMVVTSALQLNPSTFEDPIKFNPWRWKDIDSHSISKNFMPFGGGMRQCAGAEYSRVFLSTFFHVLVTKYRWTTIKGARIARNPILGFGDGIHIKFSEKKK